MRIVERVIEPGEEIPIAHKCHFAPASPPHFRCRQGGLGRELAAAVHNCVLRIQCRLPLGRISIHPMEHGTNAIQKPNGVLLLILISQIRPHHPRHEHHRYDPPRHQVANRLGLSLRHDGTIPHGAVFLNLGRDNALRDFHDITVVV
ncbi:hypothetical protein D3C72_1539840 [compost metagenome]